MADQQQGGQEDTEPWDAPSTPPASLPLAVRDAGSVAVAGGPRVDFATDIGKCRSRQEDAISVAARDGVLVVAVADGHGGPEVARLCRDQLAAEALRRIAEGGADPAAALRAAFDEMQAIVVEEAIAGGACAAAVAVCGGALHVAHVGDCGVFARTRDGRDVALTADHTPARERDRIEAKGGKLHYCGDTLRVEGILATGRAIGNLGIRGWTQVKVGDLDGVERGDFLLYAPPDASAHSVADFAVVAVVSDGFTHFRYNPKEVMDAVVGGDLAALCAESEHDNCTVARITFA